MRRLILGGLVVLAAAGTLAAVAARRSPVRSGLHLETAKVDRGRIVGRVTATGSVSALVTVQVGSQVSGRIAAIHADFGSQVKQGEIIARIDPRLFQAAAEQARANRRAAGGKLGEAVARAADAHHKLDRARLLLGQNLVPQAEYDSLLAEANGADAAIESARGNLAQTQAAEHQAQANLEFTVITSPINGVVISRNVDVGQTVAASLQAPTLFTIAEDLAKMQVHTAVAEGDVGKLRPGVAAFFSVDAYPDERFRGAIRQVRDAPQVLQNVVTYDAVIDVDNSSLKLKPGMTANVTFVYADRADVLRLPNAALRFRPSPEVLERFDAEADLPVADGGAPARSVWILRQGEPVQIGIALGITDGLLTEIAAGEVAEGDAVLTDALDLGGGGPRSGGIKKAKRIF